MRSNVGVAFLAGALALAGCVERKLIVVSDPPDAVLTLDGEVQAGRTPLELPFDWDGVRHVTLAAPGCKVLDTTAELEAHWYDWFPLDVFAEFLWPGTIEDVQRFEYRLEPYVQERRDFAPHLPELKARMAEMKVRAASHRAGGSNGPADAVPADAAAPVEEPPPPPPPETAPGK